jgi:hypothetical protein
LVSGLPTEELVRRVHFHARQGEISHRALGFYLRELQTQGTFRPGFESVAHWAAAKLEIDLKLVQELIRIAAKLDKLPRIDRAFSRGRLSWTKAKILAQVATPQTEARWLRTAKRSTCRELRDAVRRLGGEEGATPGGGLGCHRTAYAVHVKVSPLVHEVVDKAFSKFEFGALLTRSGSPGSSRSRRADEGDIGAIVEEAQRRDRRSWRSP